MFKKIFKAAKDLIRSPVGQIGLGILVPGLAGSSNALLSGIGAFAKTNPALFQAGLGLASGAKPEDVLRNVAFSAGTSALRGGMSGQGGVSEFFGMGQPAAKQIAPAVQNTPQGGSVTFSGDASRNMFDVFPTEANMSRTLNLPSKTPVTDPTFLQRMGFEITEKVNPYTGEMMPVTNFFERYSPLIKLGGIGFSVAAAALGEEQAKALYDPNKNPYLTGETKITDVYQPMNQGGGVMDFPEKDGMINGPGDGQSDDIPAMLSDGEFVMTKQAVMAAGDGDREKGTKKMYEMMYSLQDKAKDMGIGKL
jgi:hypothetical protein